MHAPVSSQYSSQYLLVIVIRRTGCQFSLIVLPRNASTDRLCLWLCLQAAFVDTPEPRARAWLPDVFDCERMHDPLNLNLLLSFRLVYSESF
jgi:hypothetical protein